MQDKISLHITNRAHLQLLQQSFDYIVTKIAVLDVKNLNRAFNELLENVLFHAYKGSQTINLHVNFFLENSHIVIEVHESGMPFDFQRYLKEDINGNDDHSKGFYHIYDLVEYFTFKRLKNGSKCFTLTQLLQYPYEPISQHNIVKEPNKKEVLKQLTYSTFHPNDAEGITQLIYKNYDYTYYKSRYYNPQEILKANLSEEIISIVCKDRKEVVGHFAIVQSSSSNIAEIAVAIVDPMYKRLGIMSSMFDMLIKESKEHGFSTIYGEGMMIHPYSQKANLRQNMVESAVILGEVPSQMEIEHTIKDTERSGVVVAFLLFQHRKRSLFLPHIYKEEITKVYSRANIKIMPALEAKAIESKLHVKTNALLNVATIITSGKFDKKTFSHQLNQLLSGHYDMIFVDIALQECEEIDSIINALNSYNFFYSGVLFNFYNNRDYLRLQRKNSTMVDEEHLICYSDNAASLLKFIQNDEKRVAKLS